LEARELDLIPKVYNPDSQCPQSIGGSLALKCYRCQQHFSIGKKTDEVFITDVLWLVVDSDPAVHDSK
jgi:hypothetical protein